jgi:hypothetical protein
MRETRATHSAPWARSALIAFGLALGLASVASAAPVTVVFAGVVQSLGVGPNIGITVGMPVVGRYTYDGSTSGSCVANSCSYAGAITSFYVSVPGTSSSAQDLLVVGGSEIRLSRSSTVGPPLRPRCTGLCPRTTTWSLTYAARAFAAGGLSLLRSSSRSCTGYSTLPSMSSSLGGTGRQRTLDRASCGWL